MSAAQLELALGKLTAVNFDAVKIWRKGKEENPGLFDEETYEELTVPGITTTKVIDVFLRKLRVKDPEIIPLAIDTARECSQNTFAEEFEDAIVQLTVDKLKTAKPADHKKRMKVINKLLTNLDKRGMADRREELEEALTAGGITDLSVNAAATAVPKVNETSSNRHWRIIKETIDQNYSYLCEVISLSSGDLDNQLVTSGILVGSDLKKIEKAGNPVRFMLEEYVKKKPTLWTKFLEALKEASQGHVSEFLQEEYNKRNAGS